MGGGLQPITVWENTEQLLEERGLGSQLGSGVGMSAACSGTLDMSKASVSFMIPSIPHTSMDKCRNTHEGASSSSLIT